MNVYEEKMETKVFQLIFVISAINVCANAMPSPAATAKELKAPSRSSISKGSSGNVRIINTEPFILSLEIPHEKEERRSGFVKR